MFLTHDPARQYANPYSYGNGDPMNGTDPSGADFVTFAIVIGIAFAIGFAVSAAQAAANGARLGDALTAGLVGGAISAAGAAVAGLGVLAAGGATTAGGIAITRLAVFAAVAGTGAAFAQGQYVAGARVLYCSHTGSTKAMSPYGGMGRRKRREVRPRGLGDRTTIQIHKG
jgi:hypothetical protein